MTDATLTMTPARSVATSKPRLERIAGASGLIFAVVVAANTLIVGSMSPPRGDATAAEITAFVTAHETALTMLVGLVSVAAVALCVFIASLSQRLGRGSEEAGLWVRLGTLGLGFIVAFFLSGIVFEAVLIADAERLAEQGGLTETLWRLRDAARVFSGLFIGLAMLGLSRAGRLTGLIPAWQEALGLAGASAFFASAITIVPAIDGSPVGLLGFAGFAVWVVWLATTSVRLLRRGSAAN